MELRFTVWLSPVGFLSIPKDFLIALICTLVCPLVLLGNPLPNVNDNPSFTIGSNITDAAFPTPLKWIIKEGKTPLSVEDLVENNLRDANLISLDSKETFKVHTKSAYWFNIEISDQTNLLENSLHLFRGGNCWPWEITFYKVEAFQVQSGAVVCIGLSGNSIPASRRDSPKHLNPSILTLNKATIDGSNIWVRMTFVESCNLRIESAFINDAVGLGPTPFNYAAVSNSMLAGAIVCLFLIGLFLFYKYREGIYLWFFICLIILFINRLFIGFTNEIYTSLFSEHPRAMVFCFTLVVTFLLIGMLQFWRTYVNTFKEHPKVDKAIAISAMLIFIISCLGVIGRFTNVNIDYWFQLRHIVIFCIFGVIVSIAGYLIWRGSQLARFISIGFVLAFSSMMIAIITINMLPKSDYDIFNGSVGLAMVLVMTVSLVYRFVLVTNQKEAALIENVEIEKLNQAQALEIKLEQAEAERLKELDDFKSELYTNLTHEFRTPLTVILGMTEQVKSNPKKHLAEATRLIESNGKSLLLLINQLLDLSKLENKSFQLQMKNGDLVSYSKYITESFQSLSNSKNLTLQFIPSVEKLEMDFDPEQIKQVLTNLISNAIKFTPSDGEIKIKLSKDETTAPPQAILSVVDTGIGIAAENLSRIFHRFYQVVDRDKHKNAGTGIGLAHSKQLVELMGGNISVKSELAKGTNFIVRLPISNISSTEVSTSGLEMNPDVFSTLSKPSPIKIKSITSSKEASDLPSLLIIEDNPDVLIYIKSVLEESYQLDTALNGKLGIEKALETIPDLIISDVMMPEKDGFEVCETLKNDERTSHIPLILLTAKSDNASKIAGLRRGADAYIAKPFDKEELLVRLEKLVERQSRLVAYFTREQQENTSTSLPPEMLELEDVFIQKVKGILAKHYMDENFALPNLCQKIGMSRSQLFRKMKALVNTSPSQYIRNYRLNAAKTFLEQSDLNVSEVAWKVGFKDLSHFSKAFQDKYGILPSSIANK